MVTWFISKFFQHRHKVLVEHYRERRSAASMARRLRGSRPAHV
jgi:hypothetical protein